jgi:2-methylcitrate dehydratase PrpD
MLTVDVPAKSPTQAIAHFAAALEFDDLPAQVVDKVKQMILDSLGTAIAATTLGDGCRETVAVMSALGGKAESSIIGMGTKVSAPNAAFANGALVHALNYDPIGSQIGHLGVVCLAAPLAMAEAVGALSGRDFLVASAVACEVSARITAAIARTGRRPSEKFLSGQLLSYFGAAVGAGKILKLDAEKMRSALGLALMQMAGSRQIVLSGDPPAKAIYGAFPCHAGVLAGLLSKQGLGADCDVFGDPAGLYSMIYGGDGDISALTEGLGSEFLLNEVEFKPWPTSNQIHPFIEAAGKIAARGLNTSCITAVEIIAHTSLRPWCEPLQKRRRPENAAAAANSIPFCVAKALVGGEVKLVDFTAAGLKDEAAVAVAEKVSYRLDDVSKAAVVAVKMLDGGLLQAQIETPLGHRSRPLPFHTLVEKFRDCCSHAAHRLRRDQIENLITAVEALDTLQDVGAIMTLANGSASTAV